MATGGSGCCNRRPPGQLGLRWRGSLEWGDRGEPVEVLTKDEDGLERLEMLRRRDGGWQFVCARVAMFRRREGDEGRRRMCSFTTWRSWWHCPAPRIDAHGEIGSQASAAVNSDPAGAVKMVGSKFASESSSGDERTTRSCSGDAAWCRWAHAVTDLGFRCKGAEHLLLLLDTKKTSFIVKKFRGEWKRAPLLCKQGYEHLLLPLNTHL
jgi:hypothetical protein